MICHVGLFVSSVRKQCKQWHHTACLLLKGGPVSPVAHHLGSIILHR